MKKIVVHQLMILFLSNAYGQGCSDAGFCSVGPHNDSEDSLKKKYKHRINTNISNGIGDNNVYVLTPAIQYDYKFNNNFSLQSKATLNYASGNLASAFGLGDIYVSGIYKLEKKWSKLFLLGIKVPLNSGNLKRNGLSLPMQYQSSLGTFDILAGITISRKHWEFSTAIQQPLNKQNGNSFLPQLWDSSSAVNYPPSNGFNRKGDVLLRFKYNFAIGKKIKMNTGLLGIYHLNNDFYQDQNGNHIELKGSHGTTINITLAFEYKIKEQLSLGFSAGAPIIYREIRPDGLTRSFVFSPEITYHF